MIRRPLALLTILTLAALPALADLYYETHASSGGDASNSSMNMTAEGFVKGEVAQVYFRESGNPWMRAGMYLYTPDGGRTIFLVDPENESYSEWDLEAVMGFAGAMLQGFGPLLSLEIEEPDVKVISEGAGPEVLGLPTTKYEIESHYVILIKIMGIKKRQEIHERSTILTTKALPEVGVGMWLRSDPPKTGHADLDRIAEDAFSRTQGATVKMRTESVVTGKKGKEEKSWTEFELVKLDRNSGGPPDGYGYPDHYTRTSMMPTQEELAGGQAGGDDGKDGKKKKRFGGLFDKD